MHGQTDGRFEVDRHAVQQSVVDDVKRDDHAAQLEDGRPESADKVLNSAAMPSLSDPIPPAPGRPGLLR